MALVDSEHVTAGRNLSIHLIHPSHFIVEKTRPSVGKTLVQDTNQLTIRTRARVQCLLSPRALPDHSGWWREHPENRKANRKGWGGCLVQIFVTTKADRVQAELKCMATETEVLSSAKGSN